MELNEAYCLCCMSTVCLLFLTFLHPSLHLSPGKLLLFLGTVLDGHPGGKLEGMSGAKVKILTWFFIMTYEYFKIKVSNPPD